jgi:hypothetical protein
VVVDPDSGAWTLPSECARRRTFIYSYLLRTTCTSHRSFSASRHTRCPLCQSYNLAAALTAPTRRTDDGLPARSHPYSRTRHPVPSSSTTRHPLLRSMAHQSYPQVIPNRSSSGSGRHERQQQQQQHQGVSDYSPYAAQVSGCPGWRNGFETRANNPTQNAMIGYHTRSPSSAGMVSSSSMTNLSMGMQGMSTAGTYPVYGAEYGMQHATSPPASDYANFQQPMMSSVYASGSGSNDPSPPTSSGMVAPYTEQYYPAQYPRTVGTSSPSADPFEAYQRRIKELELVNEQNRLRIKELEHELARDGSSWSGRQASSMVTPAPAASVSPSFEVSWRARTEARIRQFCGLNRAGNALCAWHETRRERRAYPPRGAPAGILNCGCTYDEALFEESLARHGVGAYYPGDSVRMDPHLRNP